MHTLPNTSDRRFLRGILFMLIISTSITGAIATSAAVMTAQSTTIPTYLAAVGK